MSGPQLIAVPYPEKLTKFDACRSNVITRLLKTNDTRLSAELFFSLIFRKLVSTINDERLSWESYSFNRTLEIVLIVVPLSITLCFILLQYHQYIYITQFKCVSIILNIIWGYARNEKRQSLMWDTSGWLFALQNTRIVSSFNLRPWVLYVHTCVRLLEYYCIKHIKSLR